MRIVKRLMLALILLGLVGGGAAWYLRRNTASAVKYRTAVVKEGDVIATIGATGTVEPEEVVDVGAQVAGEIKSFGIDANGKQIDYTSPVEKDTVLAKIDDSLYLADKASAEAAIAQANASLTSAKATVERAKADLGQMQAKLTQAKADWERAQKLGEEAISKSTYVGYKAAYDIAEANLDVGRKTVAQNEASVKQAEASIQQATAALRKAERNLGYCTIKSPVKGVIIDRRVNIGQTVVSSLNAPSLFLIAKDLSKMQVWVQVNEADIANIYPGQPATFTVDARPGQTFTGTVNKIRLNATMTQNVVTFTVEVNTDNRSLVLVPYLTANVKFETARRHNVLMVPNAALSYSPASPDQVVQQYRDQYAKGRGSQSSEASEIPQALTTRPTARATTRPTTQAVRMRQRTLWVKDGELLKPITVQAGLSDGTMTEVQGSELRPGMEIVIGEDRQEKSGDAGASPLMPQFRRSRPQQTGPGGGPGGAGGPGGPGGGGPGGGGMRGGRGG